MHKASDFCQGDFSGLFRRPSRLHRCAHKNRGFEIKCLQVIETLQDYKSTASDLQSGEHGLEAVRKRSAHKFWALAVGVSHPNKGRAAPEGQIQRNTNN